jgi:hypothetical protein
MRHEIDFQRTDEGEVKILLHFLIFERKFLYRSTANESVWLPAMTIAE